jgi:hypothetical protein
MTNTNFDIEKSIYAVNYSYYFLWLCKKTKVNKTQIQAVSSMNNNKDPEIDKINKEKELNINRK